MSIDLNDGYITWLLLFGNCRKRPERHGVFAAEHHYKFTSKSSTLLLRQSSIFSGARAVPVPKETVPSYGTESITASASLTSFVLTTLSIIFLKPWVPTKYLQYYNPNHSPACEFHRFFSNLCLYAPARALPRAS